MPSIEEDGINGERAFANLCNQWKCEYLHIRQDKDGLSSEMFKHYEKRPDFLVNIPDVAPVFVEVKAYTPGPLGHAGWKAQLQTFRENHEKFSRIQNFERKIRMSTWYAFFAKSKFHLEESKVYLCPVSRMEKWIPRNMTGDFGRWPYISVPIRCMNECSKASFDISDKCLSCPDELCNRKDL